MNNRQIILFEAKALSVKKGNISLLSTCSCLSHIIQYTVFTQTSYRIKRTVFVALLAFNFTEKYNIKFEIHLVYFLKESK